MGWYFWYVVGLIVGAIATIVITRLINGSRTPRGTLTVDRSDPDKLVYLFDIEELSSIDRSGIIVLNIKYKSHN